MAHLTHRPRRLRRTATLRAMVRETRLDAANLIYPLFVCPGEGVRREVRSMPGVFNLSVDELVKEAEAARHLGVSSVIVFGLPEHKDEQGSDAFAEDGITQRAIRALKREVKDLLVIADTCLCEYTSHGHCGVIKDGDVANDPTLDLLAHTAVSQAQAGADVIAPSGMMDGMVRRFAPGSMRRARLRFRSSLMRSSMPQLSTGLFAKPPIAPRSSVIDAVTRWTRPMPARRCVRRSWMSSRARIC